MPLARHLAENRSHHRIVVYPGRKVEDVVELECVELVGLWRRRIDLDKGLPVQALGHENHHPVPLPQLAVARLNHFVARDLGLPVGPVRVKIHRTCLGRAEQHRSYNPFCHGCLSFS